MSHVYIYIYGIYTYIVNTHIHIQKGHENKSGPVVGKELKEGKNTK